MNARRTLSIGLFGLLLALVFPSALAQPADATGAAPDVEALVETALSRAPSLAALQARLSAARQREEPAGALPDPMIEARLQNISLDEWTVGEMDMSMVGVEVRQGLPWPGKRAARRSAAQAESEERRLEIESLRRQLARQVRVLYAKTYALDRESDALSAGRQLLDLMESAIASRYSAGAGGQEEIVKVQLRRSSLDERTTDVSAERAAAVVALNRLLDYPGDAPLGAVGALPDASGPDRPWRDAAIQNAVELAMKRAALETARRRVLVAEKDLHPDFFAGAGISSRGRLDPVVMLSVGMELPVYRKHKQQPLLRAAEADLSAAEADVRDAELAVEAEAGRLAVEWERAQAQIARYRSAILPQTEAALAAARAAYLTGGGDFSTMVEDFNLWLEARAMLARQESALYSTWAELAELTTSPTPRATEGESR